MKFNPFAWHEVKPNEKNKITQGRLRLQCSAPSALYIESEGYEALAGYSSNFDVDLSEAASFKIEAANGVRVFQYLPSSTSVEITEEVYTNIDRMVHDSGPMAEVKKALRAFEIEKRRTLADIQLERHKLNAQIKSSEKKQNPPDESEKQNPPDESEKQIDKKETQE